ncbi:MAG: DUF1800 domain-containing protein [Lautropia sp.]
MRDIDTFTALNRFGLGPAPGDADAASGDARGWVKSQIAANPAIPDALRRFRPSDEISAGIHKARLEGPMELNAATGKAYRGDFSPEVVARARLMSATRTPFAERMVLFWSNHFTVSSAKRIVGPTIPAFERETIRPFVFGTFADMLKAVSRHPSMINYLDNQVSIGERSPAGRRRIRRTGTEKTLNENLAREILELHTLGVDGGYTQRDVIELAKAISGWSHGGLRFKGDDRPVNGRFEFRLEFHEPGPKTVLGKAYPEAGADEGLAVLDDLAYHPSTARFIATKLVRHFVADVPPAGAVQRIARKFRDTGGDLAAVSAALVDLDEAWAEPTAKAKTHYELVVSAHRATGSTRAEARDIIEPLREMGQVPFSAPSPAGWGDTASHWIAPEVLMRRIEWLRRYSATLPSTLFPDRFLDDTIGPVASDATRTWVGRAPSGDAALAMVLASPEFQRR